jgi:hypothetical protein
MAPGSTAHKGIELIQVAICIPARNEADELPSLFAALDGLILPTPAEVMVCLLLDSCTDESFSLAAAYQQVSRHSVYLAQRWGMPSNAGRARHASVQLGLSGLTSPEAIILTTDADSSPAPDWLITMTEALQDADVVAGRIWRRERTAALQGRIEAYYDMLFLMRRALDPVPWEAATTHHQTGGANLGMRRAAYRVSGGFQPLTSGEDAAFIDDASRAGLRVRRDATCLVRTSDRRYGRAAGGMASTLRLLDHDDAVGVRLGHPIDMAWQYRMHAQARVAYDADRLDIIADALGLTPDHVLGVARDCPNSEAFAMRLVPAPPGGMRYLSLAQAETELDTLTAARHAA